MVSGSYALSASFSAMPFTGAVSSVYASEALTKKSKAMYLSGTGASSSPSVKTVIKTKSKANYISVSALK